MTMMLGGVIGGYCANGKLTTATNPARVITIDRTDAKIGLSMKKCENMRVSGQESGVSGIRSQGSGVRGQGSGVRGQGSGFRSQGSGVRGQEPGDSVSNDFQQRFS